MKNKIQIKILTEKLMALKGHKLGLENLLFRFSPPTLGEIYAAIGHIELAIIFTENEIKRFKELNKKESND